MSSTQDYQWIIQPSPSQKNKEADLPRILNLLLEQKNILEQEREQFLQPRLSHLQDPYLLPEMQAAVERIFQAIDAEESICIYGDYDVDGITSVTLMHEILSAYGVKVQYFIPHRSSEGYGLSKLALQRLFQENENIDLLITVDCGTASTEEIDFLVEQKIDVIVVDHHEMSPKGRPQCVALVNPKFSGKNFEYLCAAGVVFKLMHALLKHRRLPDFDLKDYIDLVALATISDIVPLIEENRLLVRHGLQRLPKSKHCGLLALQQIAELKQPISSMDVGFRIGPRINAAGRMDSPEDALHILLTKDPHQAKILANKLNTYNQKRQQLERQIREEALAQLEQDPTMAEQPAIVLGSRSWHPGVVGIVASRLMRQFHKPTFIVAIDEDGNGKGSGRSIEGVSLVKAIHACQGQLLSGGGHDMAAGISIKEDQMAGFRSAFCEHILTNTTPEDRAPRLHLNAEVTFDELSLSFLDSYDLLQPFGNSNPQPVFFARNIWLTEPPRYLKNKHLKLFMRQHYSEKDAIFFGGGEQTLPDPPWDIAFTIDRNNFRDIVSLQIFIQAVRPAQA